MELVTVESLLDLEDEEFVDAVTDDLQLAGGAHGPFQDGRVIDRTYAALIERLGFVNETLRHKAEDPKVTPIEYGGALKFRRHVLTVLDAVERQMTWQQGVNARYLSKWKNLVNMLCDEIEGDDIFDEVLDDDDFRIPHGRGGGGPRLTLREWLEVRRIKDPSRVPAYRGEEAA